MTSMPSRVDAHCHVLPRLGHGISPEGASLAADFLAQVLAGQEAGRCLMELGPDTFGDLPVGTTGAGPAGSASRRSSRRQLATTPARVLERAVALAQE